MASVSLPAEVASAVAGDLLTADEVAAFLRMTPAWVYAQTRNRKIPHLRLGRYVRYRREALVQWMEQLEHASSSPSRSSRRIDRSALH